MTGSKALPGPGAEIDEVEASRAPLMDHLIELRNRLIWCIVAVVVCGVVAFAFSQHVLTFILGPFADQARASAEKAALASGADVEAAVKEATRAYFTAPLEILILRLKVGVVLGLAAAFPMIAYQVYAFVAPGLYKNERGAVAPYLIAIPFLFAVGAAIVYFVLLPLVMSFAFSTQFTGGDTEVTYLPKVTEYYSLAISLFTAFGLAFQLPVILALLAQADIVSASMLRKGRKYAIVAIFAVAMIMTPPDIFSQSVLAIPVCLLYEGSIFTVWMIERSRKRRQAVEAAAEAKASKSTTVAVPPDEPS
ncbi:MAG: twin-arginine translocase subunit TatC [Hyphomonadaceae bacterium]